MIDSPLVTSDALAPPAGQPQYSPAFLKADADMEKLAGDKVPQSLRYQYWQAINGDKLAKIDPRSAALAYDTSIMTSPQKAFELVKQTGGDPTKMYQARNVYAQQLVAQDPAKYQPMMDRWTQHNTALGQSLGLVPAANQQRQEAPAPAAAPAASDRDTMINNIMRTIRGGESSGKYGTTSFAEGKGSTASGGYQFADDTWRDWARRTGGEATKYARAKDAPSAVQDAVAKNYVSDILRRNGNNPEAVFKEWYGGPKGYLTQKELEVNRGLTMDKYLANRMASYNKIAGGQAGTEQVASDQGAAQTKAPPEPEKSTFEQAADAVSAGISGAGEAKKPEEAPAIPTTKPNIPLPTEPIAPSQRELYAKALDTINKRNAANPPTQSPTPPDQRPPIAKPEGQPAEQPTEKEVETPNDSEA
jgi:hypothetical protein